MTKARFVPDTSPGAQPGDVIVYTDPADTAADPVAEAEQLRYIAVPIPPPELLYGRIGAWARTATANSEAAPHAVFLAMVSYAGVCFGRDAHCWVGDTRHHPRILHLHIGRTARGRKGTSVSPVERLHEALLDEDSVTAELCRSNGTPSPQSVAPHTHTGGLSTREGLAWRIRDPVYGRGKDGEEVLEDEGEPDKRLFVLESEFENVLVQSARDGNTLSSALRDCFDGRDLAPLTKTNRTAASNPHVGVVGHITPSELLALLKDRQITNGFLNRFLIFWGERSRLVALPKPTPAEQVRQWAAELSGAIKWVRTEAPEMLLTPEAKALYVETYLGRWADPSHSDLIAALLERAPTIAMRLSMILALSDMTSQIGVEHLRCAIAWTEYWLESVEYIWRDRVRLAAGGGVDEAVTQNAKKIVDYLRETGGSAYRTELLSTCFQRHLPASELDVALEYLQLQTPPSIAVATQPKKGKPNQTAQVISLRPEQRCEPGECGEPEATARASHVRSDCEPGEPESSDPGSHSPHSHDERMSGGRVDITHSPGSQYSPGMSEDRI